MANSKFDGSGFVGLDGAAIGDGEGGTTRPEDTWLENVVDNGARYLWRRDGVSWSGPTLGGSLRSYRRLASANWAVALWAKMTVSSSLQSIEAAIFGGLGIATSMVPTVRYRTKILSPDRQNIWFVSDVSASSSNPTLVEAERQTSKPDSEAWAWFVLEMKSDPNLDPSTAVVEPKDLTFRSDTGTYSTENIGSFYEDDVSTSSDIREDQMFTDVTTNDTGEVDTVLDTARWEQYYAYYFSDLDDYIRHHYNPKAPSGEDEIINQPAVFWLSHWRPEGVSVRKKYDPEIADRFYTPHKSESMLPNDEIDGEDVSVLPDNLDAVHGRAKSQLLGVGGGFPDIANVDTGNENGYGEYPTHWEIIQGQSDSWSNNQIRQSVTIDKDQSTLDVHFDFSAWVLADDGRPSTLSGALDQSFGARWEARARLKQMAPGDTSWANAAIIASESINIDRGDDKLWPHWPLSGRVDSLTYKEITTAINGGTDGEIGRGHRNGLIYGSVGDRNISDWKLFFSRTISLDLNSFDGLQSIRLDPMRLSLDFRVIDTEDNALEASFLLYVSGFHVEEESSVPGEVI